MKKNDELETNQDEIESFIKIKARKKTLKSTIFENEEIEDIIKDNADNRYLKFISISSKSLIFKANKKFRDLINSKGTDSAENYILSVIENLLKVNNIYIPLSNLKILLDIFINIDDYKIFIKLV